ncbi:MAG: caspase family protein [Chitinophagaceae bacterium]|nr:caspase family protein [Chitinophagaceae bacterium]
MTYLIFLVFSFQNVTAQTKEEKNQFKELSQTAKNFAEKAKTALKKDDIVAAEKLFWQSLSAYPVYPLLPEFYDLIKYKKSINDFKGVNAVYDSVISSLNRYEKIIVQEAGITIFDYTYKFKPTKELIVSQYRTKAFFNKEYGNVLMACNDLLASEKYQELAIQDYTLLADCSILTGNFTTAKRCISELKKIYSNGKRKAMDLQLMPYYLETSLYNATGEFDKVIPICDYIEKEDKGLNTSWDAMSRLKRAEAYAGLKNFEKAQEYLESTLKHVVINKKSPEFNYTKGLVELSGSKYLEAIESFTKNLEYKPGFMASSVTTDKFRTYTKRAEAYEALKENEKARKDFEAALVFYPDFEPAIIGLARLESRIITERKTDKVPPQITITEPAVTRGLIVKAVGNDVMIKGNAADPGGLKSVTINGEKVYSQEGGTFWGNIALKEGMNKVTVAATDFSGNTGEQVFDIERPASVVALKAEPVKEGRNFALLIGCQNYDDNTIPSLDNPIADAIKLKLILKNNYNFSETNIITLFNPEQSDFKKQFLELNEEILPEDNLVIFYAGHGIWVEKEKKGYWMLTDAKLNDVNTWLPNKEVLNMIARLPARHTLLITDACFSGSVFKTRGLNTDIPLAVQQMNQKISRVAITSGNDTEVPDKSVFMKYLVKALSENKEKYLTAQKMFIT